MIATARGDAAVTSRDSTRLGELGAETAHLSFFHRTPNLRDLVLSQDVIYVGGGNTKSMLAVWREWQLPELLVEAYHSGIVMSGQSAGAICWFQHGVTDSWADRLRPLDCLGILPGSCCPHYDGEVERRPAYHALIRSGDLPAGYAIEDGVAVHFKNGTFERVVSKRGGSQAYYVCVENGQVTERALETMPVSR